MHKSIKDARTVTYMCAYMYVPAYFPASLSRYQQRSGTASAWPEPQVSPNDWQPGVLWETWRHVPSGHNGHNDEGGSVVLSRLVSMEAFPHSPDRRVILGGPEREARLTVRRRAVGLWTNERRPAREVGPAIG